MFDLVWVVKDPESKVVYQSRDYDEVKWIYVLYLEKEGRGYYIDFISIP